MKKRTNRNNKDLSYVKFSSDFR